MGSVRVSSCRCCICALCTSCGSPQCCVLHDIQFVNAGRGCKRPYGRDILQSRSHDCLVGNHACLILFPHAVAVSDFIIYRGLYACTEMWMCLLYASFGPKVRSLTPVQLLRGEIWACMRYPYLCSY